MFKAVKFECTGENCKKIILSIPLLLHQNLDSAEQNQSDLDQRKLFISSQFQFQSLDKNVTKKRRGQYTNLHHETVDLILKNLFLEKRVVKKKQLKKAIWTTTSLYKV
jgi:hypothetical protein